MSTISLAISTCTVVPITAEPAGGNVIPTPNPNWANINFVPLSREWTYNKQQIQGIDEAIVLRVASDTNPGDANKIYINVSSSNPSWTNGGTSPDAPDVLGFTEITSFPYDFTVQPNEYVSFGIWMQESGTYSYTMTVSNLSDSGTVLDTFTASSSGSNVIPTPNPDWGYIYVDNGNFSWKVTKQQILEITEPINISFLSSPNIGSGENVMVYVSSENPAWGNEEVIYESPSILGFSVLNEGTPISVSRNDWVSFAIESADNIPVQYGLTIQNEADSFAVIDTFEAEVFGL